MVVGTIVEVMVDGSRMLQGPYHDLQSLCERVI